MLQIGDLVEIKSAIKDDKIIGFIHTISDGKVGVRWLNNSEYYDTHLSVFNNPLDYLRKVDKVEE